ncbi:MAG: aminomethyl-transferring glycine dehydrogenase [Cytophagales bacterium]|jgi:glycine dehydrogenase|nr:aminomethyl-transferring glycine dehydrogenase [Cytophagales bacterium]MCA6387135.1 aminomethyl-transferring glycine dehydrogenase [Cytophagales bacterium]MCA6390380.1 aminomethyl-transferring glycine dehydrogenase [Cytophagales bacterium]MCA6396115.1 aminomethyl-transferring glycine dehydrogenase [Cytophagales bacterium]MCA6399712.1 aminomethyl-transferring glycine dehydrogenase [Cytophagales bacterium]
MIDPTYSEKFESRHNAPNANQIAEMLKVVKAKSVDEVIDQTVPANIRLKKALNLPAAQSEFEFLNEFKKMVSKNKIYKSYIGTGYYNCITPGVILRNILENPGWYTAYTPYQAEIAQGRMEALINYQTMVIDLTGMEIANASLLDEATAAAEALHLLYASKKSSKKDAHKFFVDEHTFPQVIDLLKTRANPIGVDLVVGDLSKLDLTEPNLFGIYIQNPNNNGEVKDYTSLIESAHEKEVFVVMGADLMSLLLVKSPGEMGADVVVGCSQRFGVPMGFGGPHAAFFATKDEFKRQMPGRIIGISQDAEGNPGYRMALQTREQHIRREKATSNICTAQVLLSVMASMYAVYHGPEGLKKIAGRIHGLANVLESNLKAAGFKQVNAAYFDTLKIAVADKKAIEREAIKHELNFRYFNDDYVGISLDETTSLKDIHAILKVFGVSTSSNGLKATTTLPASLVRKSNFLTHPIFNSHHSEHEMLRYIKKLESKDLSMVHSMISLGSCTMKLNATTEMIPVTWPEMGQIHPFAPSDQTQGYSEMISNLEVWLKEITGFTGISLQPNSGAQGEYAGLMVIRAYHQNRGDHHRNIALIPSSAHGTNPASAVMAGMEVVVTKSDAEGKIDVADLKAKAEQYKNNLACLMVTYPSTHGVFEEAIIDICETIHQNGGLVYMDGANMNAQVGLTSPANIGADVCHLNLHKTFCIPHGGGGPGMGPICCNDKLKPFLPGHAVVKTGGEKAISAVSGAPWGSASILAISYAYIAMMGSEGLTNATKLAIFNANYIKERLSGHYKILYTSTQGRCAHEMIVDCRDFKKFGVEVEDIAKRLMDYGFHAPTVSFPVAGTIMIEPTESEPKAEMDRFVDALIEIRNEIREVEEGKADKENNVLKHAPHTAAVITADSWNLPYSRQKAAYPLSFVKEAKFWPTVSRVDNAYGDRNLVCSCLPIEEYVS